MLVSMRRGTNGYLQILCFHLLKLTLADRSFSLPSSPTLIAIKSTLRELTARINLDDP